MSLPTRVLGGTGLSVSVQGLGCMSMTDFAYGPADEDEAIATVHRALDLGVTLLDTADVYGLTENEKLVARALAGRRDEAVLAPWPPTTSAEPSPASSTATWNATSSSSRS